MNHNKYARLTVAALLFICIGCGSTKFSDIPYLKASELTRKNTEGSATAPSLSIYTPRNKKNAAVLLFIHGGNWNSGSKETYWFLGRNFARKEVVTVIPGYTLSPNANYDTMAKQIAQAVLWTKDNIAQYGGDSERIYLMGHSAGGHLAALVGTNPKYLENPEAYIKGLILDDAAKLDAYSLFQSYPPDTENDYETTWTLDPTQWKNASPIYFLNATTPAIKMYVGTKTYASIAKYNPIFLEQLQKFQPDATINYLNKKHVPMITQFIWPWNNRYTEIKQFMNAID